MAFTDQRTEYDSGELITWQNFDILAENDAYKNLPSGTRLIFFQAAAPTGWTKFTGADTRALRVVDGVGAGGVTGGGAYFLGTAITLAHSHTTSGHTHTMNHNHNLETEQQSGTISPGTANEYIASADSDGAPLRNQVAGAGGVRHSYTWILNNTSPTSGSASPSSDSSLSDITIKYFDAIICTKN